MRKLVRSLLSLLLAALLLSGAFAAMSMVFAEGDPYLDWDVPVVTDYSTVPLVAGQRIVQGESKSSTEYKVYSYDYYGPDTIAEWVDFYIESISRDCPFEQVDYQYENLRDVGSEYESYFFRYTGDKSLSYIRTSYGDQKNIAEYDLEVAVSHLHSRDHVCISVKMPKELTFAGEWHQEGAWFNTVDGIEPEPNDDSNDNSNSGYTPYRPETPCTRCHGSKEITCTQCNGSEGKWVYTNSAIGGNRGQTWEECTKCKGSGTIPCTRCGGSGNEP